MAHEDDDDLWTEVSWVSTAAILLMQYYERKRSMEISYQSSAARLLPVAMSMSLSHSFGTNCTSLNCSLQLYGEAAPLEEQRSAAVRPDVALPAPEKPPHAALPPPPPAETLHPHGARPHIPCRPLLIIRLSAV